MLSMFPRGWLVACLLVAAGGCHLLWPLEDVPSSPGDAGRDGTRDTSDRTRDAGPDGRYADLRACPWQISDDFEQALLPERILIGDGCSSNAVISIDAVDGYLAIWPAPGEPDFCHAMYYPAGMSSIDLSGGGWVSVEVLQTVGSDPGAYGAEMGLTITDGTWEVNTLFFDGKLQFRVWDLDHATLPNVEDISFDLALHRHWRISHVPPSHVVWETSPDGTTWEERRRLASTPLDFGSVWLVLWAGTWQSTSDPGEARFDNFAAAAAGCP